MEKLDPAYDLGADHGMLGHPPPLVVGQRAGLVENRIGDRDLADVVEQESELDLGRVGPRQTTRPGDLDSIRGDPLGVLARIRIARLDRVRQGPHGSGVGARQLLRARALLLEGLAQVSRVALQLQRIVGRLALTAGKLVPQPVNLACQLSLASELHPSS